MEEFKVTHSDERCMRFTSIADLNKAHDLINKEENFLIYELVQVETGGATKKTIKNAALIIANAIVAKVRNGEFVLLAQEE